MAPLFERLSDAFTCFAFDTPGFGDSAALEGDVLEVADLADAIAANMDAVGLDACPVFGTHSGAAIAVLLAVRHPGKVTGLVLDGPPLFTREERDQLFDGHFEPLHIDDYGGHFAQTWTRFRDQSIWFPWRSRAPDRLNATGLSQTDALHRWTTSYFACGRTYAPPYRAAVMGFEAAHVEAVDAPMVVAALETDMLYPHLLRLPPLQIGQRVERVGAARECLNAWIADSLSRLSAPASAPPDIDVQGGADRCFLDMDHGQVHVRILGDREAPALLYLHDAPGSVRRDSALVDALAQRFRVIAPDLPGCADSDPLPLSKTQAGDFAEVCADACARLGVRPASVYGQGVGATMALTLALRDEALAGRVVLRNLPAPTADERARWQGRMAPPIQLCDDGSHWYRTWLMLRDSLIFFPWFETGPQNLLRMNADFRGDVLHEWTLDVMRQHGAYHHAIEAALACDVSSALPLLTRAPIIVPDAGHRYAAHQGRVSAMREDFEILPVRADHGAHAGDLFDLLSAEHGAREI